MFSVITADRIFEIGKKHGLQIDKIGALTQEIGWVMLGEKRAREFVENLAKALGVPHQKAYEIAQDVNHQVFFEIRENLKKIHDIPQTDALIPETSLGPIPEKPKEPEKTPAGPPRDADYWRNLNLVKPVTGQPSTKTDGIPPAKKDEVVQNEVNSLLGTSEPKKEVLPVPQLPQKEEAAIKTPAPESVKPLAPVDIKATPSPAVLPQSPEPPKPIAPALAPVTPIAPPPTPIEKPKAPAPKPETPISYGGGDPYREPVD